MPTVSAMLELAASHLDNKVRIAAVIVSAIMLGIVLELVRRRRLVERYALLWMTVSLVLIVLAIWNQLLSFAADAIGIDLAANALFLAAFAVAFLLLLHFSVITTRLSEETKILAQEVARLDGELRAARAASSNGEPASGSNGERQPGKRASTADQ
ncbi:MAG: DUF2304 domain-containing protein [Actinobacteria bacterium]|jgi:hypothetical protein|nr:MAG: DUF2304 domain-containing protein [Actinomycetota bacterium]